MASYLIFHTPEGPNSLNVSGYSNPGFDAAIQKARFERDLAKSKQYFGEALRALMQDPPGLFLGWATTPLVYRKECSGFQSSMAEFFESLKDVQCAASVPN